MYLYVFLTLSVLHVFPFSVVGAISSAFLSTYSPFADGGDSKESTSTVGDKLILDTPTESTVLNYINDSLASSLLYPRRLVKGYKMSICNETNDEIETSDAEVESLLYAPNSSKKVDIQTYELNISLLSNPCRLGKAETPTSRIHSNDCKESVYFDGDSLLSSNKVNIQTSELQTPLLSKACRQGKVNISSIQNDTNNCLKSLDFDEESLASSHNGLTKVEFQTSETLLSRKCSPVEHDSSSLLS